MLFIRCVFVVVHVFAVVGGAVVVHVVVGGGGVVNVVGVVVVIVTDALVTVVLMLLLLPKENLSPVLLHLRCCRGALAPFNTSICSHCWQ